MTKPLVMSNMDVGDTTFEHDFGVWNVTRASADCTAGKHKIYTFDVAEVLDGSAALEYDRDKVEAYAKDRELAKFKPIFIVLNNALWLIDGIHHVRAMAKRGIKECGGYVIEENDLAHYRVLFNGREHPPWKTQ